MPALLCAMHDPGGALALAQVVRLTVPEGRCVLAGEWAREMLRGKGLEAEPLPRNLSPVEADAILDASGSSVLLTATSWGGNAEQALRNAARRRGMPSVVVLDFWSNYRMRFQYADAVLEHMPDVICVMDEDTRQEMITEGFQPTRIVISGQPHLEAIFRDTPSSATEHTNRLLFLSQPDLINGITLHGKTLLRRLFQEIERMALHRKQRQTLLFKPHPKETPPALARLQELCAPHLVDVLIIDRALPLLNVLDGVESVAGGATMGLFEARARGIGATVLNGENASPALRAALRKAGIRVQPPATFNGLFEHEQLSPPPPWHVGAGARVLDIVTRSMR